MPWKLYFLSFLISLVCLSDGFKKISKWMDSSKVKVVNGVEFSNLPRGALLKLLAGYEQRLHDVIAGRRLKPVFSAQFANNKHTNEYIYPDLRKKEDLTHLRD